MIARTFGLFVAGALLVAAIPGPLGSAPDDAKTSVSAGFAHACGLDSSGRAYCWGANGLGELGDGTDSLRAEPTPVAGDLQFTLISAGGHTHNCALTSAGSAYCWGQNTFGYLGDGTKTLQRTPTAVAGGTAFRSISTGARHTCGLSRANQALCWGANIFGQLGDGTRANHGEPAPVSGGLVFTALSAGFDHTCGLVAPGTPYCWGSSDFGELGNGERGDHDAPTKVTTTLAFGQIFAGHDRTCALTAAGVAYCWGLNNYGELGSGTDTVVDATFVTHIRAVPTRVSGQLTFQSLSMGGTHTCGLTRTGEAYCWGVNSFGQLGDGTTTNRSVPSKVGGGQSFRSISAGGLHTCAVTAAGESYCWGRNLAARIGLPGAATAAAPALQPARVGGVTFKVE